MNCVSCGAPLMPHDEACTYCGTSTPYGERMSEERRREKLRYDQEAERLRQERLNRSKFKYVPVILVPVFYALTLLLYGPYWYISRSGSLNALSDTRGMKLNKWLCVFYALLCVGVFIFPSIVEDFGITKEMAAGYWAIALFFAVWLSVWLAFRARYILKAYAGGFNRKFDPFIILLFIAGPLYLQYEINRMMKAGLLQRKNILTKG